MAITNGYTTLSALKIALGIEASDKTDNATLETAIGAASRQLDEHCGPGRRFWQDSSVVARTYRPTWNRVVYTDDISTVTGLIVKVDTTDNGTFDTTLTIDTDFYVHPRNAAADSEAWTSVRLLDGSVSAFPSSSSGRAPIEVTAKFGWAAVPAAVERACVFQAKNLFKAPSATFGSFQLSDEGVASRIPSLDPLARALMERYIRIDEELDGG